MLVYLSKQHKLVEVIRIQYFEKSIQYDEHIQLQLIDEDDDGDSVLILEEDDLQDNKKALRNAGFKSDSLKNLFENIVDKIWRHGKVVIPM